VSVPGCTQWLKPRGTRLQAEVSVIKKEKRGEEEKRTTKKRDLLREVKGSGKAQSPRTEYKKNHKGVRGKKGKGEEGRKQRARAV